MRIPIPPHSPISINFRRGDYSGGWLWLDNGSKLGYAKNIRTQSCKHGLGSRSNQPNTSVDFPFSGRNKWFKFDGRKPHCVTPFSGRRYTLATWWMLWGKEKSQVWTYSMQKLIIIIDHYMILYVFYMYSVNHFRTQRQTGTACGTAPCGSEKKTVDRVWCGHQSFISHWTAGIACAHLLKYLLP